MDSKPRILIVDDSPFFILLLKDHLASLGYEVVGTASSLEETEKQVLQLKPDLVTVDMTIPGTSGFECTKTILEIDASIKVIIISSMMDDVIVKRAKVIGASGYIQKPIDDIELASELKRVLSLKINEEDLFLELTSLYPNIFKEAFSTFVKKVTDIDVQFEAAEKVVEPMMTRGISILVPIKGSYSGRVVLDISVETASKFAAKALMARGIENFPDEMVHHGVAEMINGIAGNASSMLNKLNSTFDFRVAPATVFHNGEFQITNSKMQTETAFKVITEYGDLYYNIGFKGGEIDGRQTH